MMARRTCFSTLVIGCGVLFGLDPAAAGDKGRGGYATGTFGLNEIVVGKVEPLRRQFRRCWRVPATTKKQDFDVHIRIALHPDGTVHSARVVDRPWIAVDEYRFSVAKSARGAVRSRPCNPLRIPPELVKQGERITLTLNPSDIFRP